MVATQEKPSTGACPPNVLQGRAQTRKGSVGIEVPTAGDWGFLVA